MCEALGLISSTTNINKQIKKLNKTIKIANLEKDKNRHFTKENI
jgi:hypothetical protein